MAELVGKPAPKLGQIKSWHNGEPVKLSDLKDKTVLLYFGGDNPSAFDLNRLVGLHEKFSSHGLEIVALYNTESMPALQEKWKEENK